MPRYGIPPPAEPVQCAIDATVAMTVPSSPCCRWRPGASGIDGTTHDNFRIRDAGWRRLAHARWALPFSDLTARFDGRLTGLVGRNGVGKSVLAQMMAGLRVPSAGHCRRVGRVHYLPQQVAVIPGQRVAELAAVDNVLAALLRIEAGSTDPADFDAVGEQWTLRETLQQALLDAGLEGISADMPVDKLSGGQRMRVALVGALLQPVELLILDEPSNHLDLAGRQWLAAQLRARGQGVLLVSHDRLLLAEVERIVELSPQGLRSHGGNYASYAQARAATKVAAETLLQQRRHERRKGEQELRVQRERLEQRSARGSRDAARPTRRRSCWACSASVPKPTPARHDSSSSNGMRGWTMRCGRRMRSWMRHHRCC